MGISKFGKFEQTIIISGELELAPLIVDFLFDKSEEKITAFQEKNFVTFIRPKSKFPILISIGYLFHSFYYTVLQ